jgi:hypothetical protein
MLQEPNVVSLGEVLLESIQRAADSPLIEPNNPSLRIRRF